MKHLDQVVAKDPLKLKKYDVGNGSSSKMIYVFLIAIPIFLVLSVVFYGLGVLFHSSNDNIAPAQPQQPVAYRNISTINEDGEEVITQVEDPATAQPKPTFTGEAISDRSKIADSFAKIQIGLKIMPSQNDEQGMIIMKWTNEANAQESKLNTAKVDVGDNYFFYQNTADYFPVLKYTPDYVPFGSADRYCVHLQWNKIEYKRMVDLYKQVQKFPVCANSQNPKYRWQANDPKTGVDFRVWTQEQHKVGSESECSKMGGVFRHHGHGDGGKCFLYNILKRLCLMIAFKESPETASYTWEFRGGCYGQGNIAVYEKAVPGEEYKFDQVPIEVREDESLYGKFTSTVVTDVEVVQGPIHSLFFLLSSITLLLALISGILFSIFFYRAWKGAQAGSSMRHQQQVDE